MRVRKLGGLPRIFRTPGRGLETFHRHTLGQKPLLNCGRRFRHGKYSLPSGILPSLGQGEATHDVARAHRNTGIRPN